MAAETSADVDIQSSGVDDVGAGGGVDGSPSPVFDPNEIFDLPSVKELDEKEDEQLGDPDEPGEAGEAESDEDDEEDKEGSSEGDDDDEDGEEDEGEDRVKALEELVKGKKPQQESTKPLKVRQGDKEVEIAPTATFLVKVDGEKKVVTARELLDTYSSAKVTDRGYRDLEKKAQAFEQQNEQFSNVIGKFAELAEAGRAVEALSILIKSTGKDPYKAIRSIRSELTQKAREWLELPEEERKKLEQEEEVEYLRQQAEERKKADSRALDQSKLENEISRVIQAYGVGSRERFEALIAPARAYAMQEIANGILPKDFVFVPEYVGKYAEKLSLTHAMNEAVSEIAPELKEDGELMRRLATAVMAHKPSKKELKRVIENLKASENGAEKRVNDRLSSKQKRRLASKPARTIDDIEDVDPGLDIEKLPSVSHLLKRA